MAADETSNVGDDQKTAEKEDYNPKLDFFSEHFDPLLALRSPNVIVPITNAITHDNIQKYKSVYEGKPQKIIKTQKTEAPQTAPIVRRWLPHQLPTHTQRKTKTKNVFTRMENVEGPLQFLKICKDNRHRIKVWTRHSHDIRGYCLAYLVAFDKHWNLVLADVEEVWTRTKKTKIPALEGTRTDLRFKPKVLPPPVTIIESTKTMETCSRYVKQLLLRGEHVAYIVIIQNKTEKLDDL